MKILVNALLLNDKFTGVQFSTQNLLSAMGQVLPINMQAEVLLSSTYKYNLPESEFFKTRKVPFSTKSRVKRICFEHLVLPQYFAKKGFDLCHFTSYISPYFSKFPTVLTVHDLIALDFPEYCQNKTSLYFKLCLPRSINNATRIIAISHTVKDNIIKRFNIDPQLIDVVYHGVGSEFKKVKSSRLLQSVINRYNLPNNFILFVGNLEPKKNIEKLIEAVCKLKANEFLPHKLVIVGKNGWKYNTIYQKIKKDKLEKHILFLGYVPQEDLPSIYSLADLFIFPSLYEGFGLPVLEAMACEIPVIISDRGALPEIAGEKSIQVNPLDVDDIAHKIWMVLTKPKIREQLIAYGTERVKMFSWHNAAIQTIDVYSKTIN